MTQSPTGGRSPPAFSRRRGPMSCPSRSSDTEDGGYLVVEVGSDGEARSVPAGRRAQGGPAPARPAQPPSGPPAQALASPEPGPWSQPPPGGAFLGGAAGGGDFLSGCDTECSFFAAAPQEQGGHRSEPPPPPQQYRPPAAAAPPVPRTGDVDVDINPADVPNQRDPGHVQLQVRAPQSGYGGGPCAGGLGAALDPSTGEDDTCTSDDSPHSPLSDTPNNSRDAGLWAGGATASAQPGAGFPPAHGWQPPPAHGWQPPSAPEQRPPPPHGWQPPPNHGWQPPPAPEQRPPPPHGWQPPPAELRPPHPVVGGGGRAEPAAGALSETGVLQRLCDTTTFRAVQHWRVGADQPDPGADRAHPGGDAAPAPGGRLQELCGTAGALRRLREICGGDGALYDTMVGWGQGGPPPEVRCSEDEAEALAVVLASEGVGDKTDLFHLVRILGTDRPEQVRALCVELLGPPRPPADLAATQDLVQREEMVAALLADGLTDEDDLRELVHFTGANEALVREMYKDRHASPKPPPRQCDQRAREALVAVLHAEGLSDKTLLRQLIDILGTDETQVRRAYHDQRGPMDASPGAEAAAAAWREQVRKVSAEHGLSEEDEAKLAVLLTAFRGNVELALDAWFDQEAARRRRGD